MILIRNILFSILFYGGSVIFVIIAGVRICISRRQGHKGAAMWSQYVIWIARHVLGIRFQVTGEIPSGAVIVAAKHQSNLETLALPSLFPWPAVVMKAELRRIPIWGWIAARHGSLFVDRNAGSSAMRAMLRAGEQAKAEMRQIVIFPEGTRTPEGEAPPLRPGIAGLYRLLKLPVVPVALSSAHVWPRSGLKRPGVARVHFLPLIPTGLKRDEFETRLHEAINRKPE
ncbi:1-acyl-sn-glycerol-3-phosphate acyltransferase [Pacificimonas sp. WHA3]|uniref:1-acyl-sn-glycerol-3-phosphate acyltransferase n=1 Tax=Pacificimonas pallii TaxID=2827236 RepID=A0ABS6SCM6_9SPHN|nr:lysophospholipid acyltransferase family protein [Pacificimonas pallii]MBV7255661.1 1-acyl-sn-glycerol-3-phosphate acyltransferase [Pacificimonas pallii]